MLERLHEVAGEVLTDWCYRIDLSGGRSLVTGTRPRTPVGRHVEPDALTDKLLAVEVVHESQAHIRPSTGGWDADPLLR